MSEKIPVKYIGERDLWIDKIYHTGLFFQQGQTRLVSADSAAKLLKHSDVFVLGGEDDSAVDSAALEQAGTDNEAEKMADFDEVQDLIQQIGLMDKAELELFAKTRYSQDLDKRKSVETLRGQVIEWVHQFGIV